MVVGGTSTTRRDRVHIDIEDAVDQRHCLDPGLFVNLADRSREYILPGIDMTARLEPSTEIAMMDQQQSSPGGVEDKTAGSDVARLEAIAAARIISSAELP